MMNIIIGPTSIRCTAKMLHDSCGTIRSGVAGDKAVTEPGGKGGKSTGEEETI